MSTTFDPQAVIPMPRMKAAAAATVGQSLGSAHDGEKKLPDNITLAHRILQELTDLLKRALMSQLDPSNESLHAEESRVEGSNWSGLYSLLDGVAGSSIRKKAALAAKLKETLFPNGLTFLRLQTAERWMETESRLNKIKEMKLDADLHTVGAADFLAAIHETHRALGDAAGITSALAVTAKSGVQATYDKWKAGARCYIAQVIAHQALSVAMAKTEAEATAANDLAERLLAPLAAVDSSLTTKSEEAPVAPTPPATGAAAPEAPAATAPAAAAK